MRSADQQPIDSTGPQSGPHQDGPTCEVKAYNAAPTGAPRTSWQAMALAGWPGASAVCENYIDNAESVSRKHSWASVVWARGPAVIRADDTGDHVFDGVPDCVG